jgi:hypothetical protein
MVNAPIESENEESDEEEEEDGDEDSDEVIILKKGFNKLRRE